MEKAQVFCLGSRATLSTGSSGSSTGFCATAACKSLSWSWKGSPQRTEPGKSRAGTGGREQRVWVAVARVRLGEGWGDRQGAQGTEGCSALGRGWRAVVSHLPFHITLTEGDMRCKWAITSTPPTGTLPGPPPTGTIRPGKHPAPPPLSSLPTMTNQGLEITRLYLRHHFHIICL